MRRPVFLMCLVASVAVVAQQPRRGGGAAARDAEPPHPSGLPSKAPEQGWVGDSGVRTKAGCCG